jgi:hypothetical protein
VIGKTFSGKVQGVYELEQNGNIKVYSGRWMRIAGERYALRLQPGRGCCSVDRPPRVDHEEYFSLQLLGAAFFTRARENRK